jgi:hypothetical protein
LFTKARRARPNDLTGTPLEREAFVAPLPLIRFFSEVM